MAMRKLLLVPLVLLFAACPKEKPAGHQCGTLEIHASPGSHATIEEDVCGLGQETIPTHFGSWSNLAPGLFSIPDAPWYLQFSFETLTGNADTGELVTWLKLDVHNNAPHGRFEGTYSYQTNLNSQAAPSFGPVIVHLSDPGRFNLDVSVVGHGTVRNNLIYCGTGAEANRCSVSYNPDEAVSLKYEADAGWAFDRVEDCDATPSGEDELSLTVSQDTTCRVSFKPNDGTMRFDVKVLGGGGEVAVEFNEMMSVVHDRDSFFLPEGSVVELVARDEPPFRFVGWEGSCSGSNPNASVTITDGQLQCTANFERSDIATLRVTIEGQGSVGIGSLPACGVETGCSTYLASPGETVPLHAVASQGHRFDHWGGNCSGSNPSTSITVNGLVSCNAVFMPSNCMGQAPPTLGQIVVSDMAGNRLGTADASCSITITKDTPITLTAESFTSNTSSPSLTYAWDRSYSMGYPVNIDAYGESTTVSWDTELEHGVRLEVTDSCMRVTSLDVCVRVE